MQQVVVDGEQSLEISAIEEDASVRQEGRN